MKKKILGLVLVCTMAVSMTACGSKVKAGNKVTITMDELQDKMTEAMKDVDSVDFDLDAKMGIGITGEEEMNLDASLDAKGQLTVGTPAAHIDFTGEMKYGSKTDSKEDKIDLEAYAVTDSDNISLYYNMNDEGWYTGEAPVDELMGEFESALSDYGMDMEGLMSQTTNPEAMESAPELKLSDKTVVAEGKECYELVTKVDKEALMKEMEAAKAELDEEMIGQADQAMDSFEKLDGTMKLYVDVDTNLPIKVVMDMSMKANFEMYETNMGIDMDEFNITLTAEYNKVKSIEVPADVKEKAIDLSE